MKNYICLKKIEEIELQSNLKGFWFVILFNIYRTLILNKFNKTKIYCNCICKTFVNHYFYIINLLLLVKLWK